MSSNSIGKNFRFTTWGESHGKAIGCVVDGVPSQIKLSEEESEQLISDNFRIPGHVPVCIADLELLKNRQGHTELIISLLKSLDMNPVSIGCEMVGEDGYSLSPERAKEWAQSEGYLFLEGRQIIEECQ